MREIIGSAESGSVSRANGIQFMNGTDAYIVLAAGGTSEKALYHELYHVMETYILGNSIALDQWAKLNPVGFEYDYDYLANAQRDGSEFLQPDTRSFVDTYSMSYPKEDRARIFEYAMTAGNEPLFAASPLQYKLKCCVRDTGGFWTEKSRKTFHGAVSEPTLWRIRENNKSAVIQNHRFQVTALFHYGFAAM